MPGLIDTHVHAPQVRVARVVLCSASARQPHPLARSARPARPLPCHPPARSQYKFTGTGTDLPLMEWLQKYTFPVESSHSDCSHAQHRYGLLVKRFLANGTTTATYFGSLHLEPNKVLVDEIVRLGQRAVVGKVRAGRGACVLAWLAGWLLRCCCLARGATLQPCAPAGEHGPRVARPLHGDPGAGGAGVGGGARVPICQGPQQQPPHPAHMPPRLCPRRACARPRSLCCTPRPSSAAASTPASRRASSPPARWR